MDSSSKSAADQQKKRAAVVFDAEVSERRILIVPIHTIRHTPYNPAGRTKEGDKLRRLIAEIETRGLIYPILITADRDVIDGNRRLAACRVLGHATVECIVSDLDRDEAFTVVNTTGIAIGGKGWLEIGMGGGHMPAKQRAQFDELHELVGSYGIKVLIDQNLGLNVLPLCKSVTALDAKYSLSAVVMRVALGKLTNKINAVIRSDLPRADKVRSLDALFGGALQ
jgi:hypothetical protein